MRRPVTEYKIVTQLSVPRELLEALTEEELHWIEQQVSLRMRQEMDRQFELMLMFGHYTNAAGLVKRQDRRLHSIINMDVVG